MADLDPTIKRIMVDPVVPGSSRTMRLAGLGMFGLFFTLTCWAKYSAPRSIEEKIAREVVDKQHHGH